MSVEILKLHLINELGSSPFIKIKVMLTGVSEHWLKISKNKIITPSVSKYMSILEKLQ